ncbi:hypothetical protein EBME_0279 [bacterium endosymbiont of Mortierella elongata FMR23-6]|nr:hypothetical protein EBME_0279 [bacterium endosymbiont of Mortierella elongata FMR23-6]
MFIPDSSLNGFSGSFKRILLGFGGEALLTRFLLELEVLDPNEKDQPFSGRRR